MTLETLFTEIANAIRGKTGETAAIKAADFPSAIEGITGGVEGAKVFGPVIGDGSNILHVDGMENSENFAVLIQDWVSQPLKRFWIVRRYATVPTTFSTHTCVLYLTSSGFQFRIDGESKADANGNISVPGYSEIGFSGVPYYVIRFD